MKRAVGAVVSLMVATGLATVAAVSWNEFMAASITANVTVVICFSIVQKRFSQGLSAGTVKV